MGLLRVYRWGYDVTYPVQSTWECGSADLLHEKLGLDLHIVYQWILYPNLFLWFIPIGWHFGVWGCLGVMSLGLYFQISGLYESLTINDLGVKFQLTFARHQKDVL